MQQQDAAVASRLPEPDAIKLPDMDLDQKKDLLSDLEKRDRPMLATQNAYGPG